MRHALLIGGHKAAGALNIPAGTHVGLDVGIKLLSCRRRNCFAHLVFTDEFHNLLGEESAYHPHGRSVLISGSTLVFFENLPDLLQGFPCVGKSCLVFIVISPHTG